MLAQRGLQNNILKLCLQSVTKLWNHSIPVGWYFFIYFIMQQKHEVSSLVTELLTCLHKELLPPFAFFRGGPFLSKTPVGELQCAVPPFLCVGFNTSGPYGHLSFSSPLVSQHRQGDRTGASGPLLCDVTGDGETREIPRVTSCLLTCSTSHSESCDPLKINNP